jgi:HEAT repeat protein
MRRFENPTESDVPQLINLFESGDAKPRKEAALALGSLGTRACTGTIVVALADDDDYVRSYAMMGIERGISAKRCQPDFLEAVFPALVKLLNRDDCSVSGTAPQLLLDIDADRAIPILLSPDYFTADNSQLAYILRALNHHNYAVPHTKLLPLLNELRTTADRYPRNFHYAEALRAYGRNPDAQAANWIRGGLRSANETIREGAAAALANLSGISDAFTYVCEIWERDGFDQLSDPQKHFYSGSG